MEEALRTFLLANAAVAALAEDRVHWGRRPQGEGLPAIVLHTASAPRTYSMAGSSGLPDRLIQMDCWGDSFGAAKLLARAVEASLAGLTAPFQGAFVESERDDNEAAEGPDAAGSTDLFRTSLDVRVWCADS